MGRGRLASTAARPVLALICAGATALALGGCGGASSPTPLSLRLQRTDFIEVCRQLQRAEPIVAAEVAATKAAWPRIDAGLAARIGPVTQAAVAAAAQRAGAIGTPGVFEEQLSASLTGPGAGIASEFRGFSVLAARGWHMIDGAVRQIAYGPVSAASFARANVALYIEAVYDSHFSLALLGKKILAGYEKLEGPKTLDSSLSQAQVEALAGFYSEPRIRLYPHESVRLGS